MALGKAGNNVSQSQGSAAGRLMSVLEARAAMLSFVRPLGDESVLLQAALGRVLAGDIVAGRDQPPFVVSAMDGYALRSEDTPGTLRIGGESAAGRGFEGCCQPGMAIRISTGAAMPDGADTVVMQEDVKREGDSVTVPASEAQKNLRPRGGDFSAGTLLLSAGRRLDGVALSLAAASGAAEVRAVRAPVSPSSAVEMSWRHRAQYRAGFKYSIPGPSASPDLFNPGAGSPIAWRLKRTISAPLRERRSVA